MKKLSNLERFNKYNKISLIIRQQRRINTLEAENEELKERLKKDLYKVFIEIQDAPYKVVRLKDENKKLRDKIKKLKEMR